MAIETYQFMNEAGVQKLAELLLTKVNLRIGERIVTEVTETSSDKQTASAKTLYTLIKALQDADTNITNRVDINNEAIINQISDIQSIEKDHNDQNIKLTNATNDFNKISELISNLTHLKFDVISSIDSVIDPQTDVLYLQRDSEEDKTLILHIYSYFH